jgi:hypothetical protein
MTTYLRVFYDTPTLPTGIPPCRTCLGTGITDDRTYDMPYDAGQFLRVDVFCSGCGGCGAARHEECAAGAHALDPDRSDPTACPSCVGRGWCAAALWSPTIPDPERTLLLRVPCACAAERAIEDAA